MKYSEQNYMVGLFKTLGNSSRIRVMKLLVSNQKPLTVNEIAFQLNLDQGNVSNHLIRMRKDGFLKAKQVGTSMYYSVKDANVAKVIGVVG